jgi:membrane associated rhomboid family serine protease
MGSSSLAFPDFRGATRRLVMMNLAAYFALALAQLASGDIFQWLFGNGVFLPQVFSIGWLWQPLTYSLMHHPSDILGTALELLSLWFLAGFLEAANSDQWVTGLYWVSVLGTALAAVAISIVAAQFHIKADVVVLSGCFGGIFGLLVAIGYLYGDVQFILFPLPIGIKAKYLAVIYGLITIAMLFGQQWVYAVATLGGALAGLFYIRVAPRRGLNFAVSERWYGLRNQYYRWKRRNAAKKFEVYMRSQGRTVHFDGKGRKIEDDPDDKKRWN